MDAKWFDLEGRSVLMDPETKQVFGQVVKSGELHWLAYDNDPAKHDGNSALLLGKFPFLVPAKAAVEKSVKK
jgi:hypothetical protein